MINCIQNNQEKNNLYIINNNVYKNIYNLLITKKYKNYKKYIYYCMYKYNLYIKNIIKYFFDYIIRNKKELLSHDFIDKIEFVINESNTNNNEILINYIYYSIFNSE